MTRRPAAAAIAGQATSIRPPGRPRDPAAHNAILRAAIDLFIEEGVEGTNIEQIARRAGVARATIYRRWRNREELLTDAMLMARNPPKGGPDAVAAMSPAGVVQFLRVTLMEALMKPKSSRLAARLIGSAPEHPAMADAYRRVFVDPWRSAMASSLRRVCEAGGLPPGTDTDILLDLLIGSVVHRLLMRSGAAILRQESRWLDLVFRQIGFTPERL